MKRSVSNLSTSTSDKPVRIYSAIARVLTGEDLATRWDRSQKVLPQAFYEGGSFPFRKALGPMICAPAGVEKNERHAESDSASDQGKGA